MRNVASGLVLALVLLAAVSAAAKTIQPGEVRTATGTVSAVDVRSSAIVVEAPTAKGTLTVGVTMSKDATVTRRGKGASLGDLTVGEKVTIKYTRDDDMLIGLEVRAR